MEEDKNIKKFTEFFCNFGELCFKIKMVERGRQVIDFTTKEGQIVNPEYFDEVKKKYPKAIRGFSIAIERKWCDAISCYLQGNGEVIVELKNKNRAIEKIITYSSVKDLNENRISLIHFLTRTWNPLD